MSLTHKSLEALLAWLDPDRERAGQKYEVIRGGLLRVFKAKGFADAEDLTDQTINRVVARLPDITANYVGEPSMYFHGVARNIIHEARRRRHITGGELPLASPQTAEMSDEHECLLKCLKALSDEERELVLDYHLYRGGDKVKHHLCMAEEQGMKPSALRVRVHRIRVTLQKCVIKCTGAVRAETKPSAASMIR